MKTASSLFAMLFISIFYVSAQTTQDKADSTYTSTWVQALDWMGPTPPTQTAIDGMLRKEIVADSVSGFDAQGAIFDEEWARIAGNGHSIANPVGLPETNGGEADFTGSFKVLYDDANIYILLKYIDDDVTGNETVELTWAPYLKLYNPKFKKLTANYFRFSQFGAAKATFGKTGYKNSMLIVPTKDAYTILWSGTTNDLTASLFLDDKTAPASTTVKQIITIGYPALTGEARPDFNPSIWRALNNGKGISFDIKVRDADTDDANQPAVHPATNSRSQDYWWNTTDNDGWIVTYLSGMLAPEKISTGISSTKANNSIFGKVTTKQIQLNSQTDVSIYNAIGKLILLSNNATKVELSTLGKGVFVVRAGNQAIKLVR
jgi:hypothetical protein